MALETILLRPAISRTSYSARQLRDALARLRQGMALQMPAGHVVLFPKRVTRTREQVLTAIDEELAAFAAFDRLLIDVAVQRQALWARLPILATVIQDLGDALKAFAGRNPPLREALGIAPGKKPRKLKVGERLAATIKLNATRQRNGTAAKKPRRRR